MTEDEAKAWMADRFGRAAMARIEYFATLLTKENERQNLVSRSSLASLWSRHIVDSAQLLELAPATGAWVDIGTGGGFPGMIVAALRDTPVVLVEPRRQRAAFLAVAAGNMNLGNVDVRQIKAAALQGICASVVSARAVASIGSLLTDAAGVANRDTVYVFPRGRSGRDELSAARRSWRGVFHVEQSITDANAVIVVARGVYAA